MSENEETRKAEVAAELAAAVNPDAPMIEIVYVVQMEMALSSENHTAWRDIATVKVPPRTKRSTVIKQALKDAGIAPNADGSKPRLRALDVDSAEVHEPEAVQPPPEWRL